MWWAAYGPPGGQTSTRFHSDVFFVVIIVLQVFLVAMIISFVIIIVFCYCIIINVTVTAIVMLFLCTRKDPVSSPGATFEKKSHNFERIEALRFLHWNIYIHRLLNSISNPKREHNLIFWLNDIFLNKGARPKVRMRDDWEWCVVYPPPPRRLLPPHSHRSPALSAFASWVSFH